ncbi:MAG: polysaccharide biosynthesis protein [Lachnospiraceae bacterium]|nr:polysaccharide biosynthesis protein [Lachnospiraceae bacterium]
MSNNGTNKASNSKDNNFVLQAGILAAAGIISRIIGLLYRSPLTAVVGTLGMGYYQVAYNFYTIVLLLSSYSIPSAISKVIAQKLAVKEYRNAHRIFKCALGYVLVVGTIASLVLFFGAGLFLDNEAAIPVLRTFAPTIFLYGILGVLRGYFQAHHSMAQTSVSQILEQIVNAAVSVGAAYALIQGIMGTLEVPGDEAALVQRATAGAIGSALGTGAGVLIALIFMGGIYALNKDTIQKRIARDRHTNVASYRDVIKTITLVVTPFIISTAVYNLSDVVNSKLYVDVMPGVLGADSTDAYNNYGIFSSMAQTISKIPIAFASAMASAMIPSVAAQMAAQKYEEARIKIGVAVKSTMVISIPCAVGLLVLAKPVTTLLFPSQSDETLTYAGYLLMALTLSIVFYALSTLNSSILQGLGKVNTPIINAAIALAVQSGLVYVLMRYTTLDLYSLAIANTAYSGMMFLLNQWAVRRAVDYKQEVLKTFGAPLLAAVFMGAVAWAVNAGLYLLTESVVISVVVAVLVAVMVYFVMLLVFRGMDEEELRGFPKGHLLVKVAKKVGLL